MPFGLSNAPITFQCIMHVMFAGLKRDIFFGYLDNVIVFSPTFQYILNAWNLFWSFEIPVAGQLKTQIIERCFYEPKLKNPWLRGWCSRAFTRPDQVRSSPNLSNPLKYLKWFKLSLFYALTIEIHSPFALTVRSLTNLTRKSTLLALSQKITTQVSNFIKSFLVPFLGHSNYNLSYGSSLRRVWWMGYCHRN